MSVTQNSIGTPLITLGDTFTLSGAFPFVGTLTASTNITFPTSGTLATLSDLPTLPLSLANGGSNANLTAAANSLVYSTPSALALLASANNGT